MKLKLILLILILALATIYPSLNRLKKEVVESQKVQQPNHRKTEETKQVLGRNIQAPQIYIYGGEQKFSSGGMIALASTDEPAVQIGGFNISGSAEVAMYEANEDALLDYLTHDKEGKQTKKTPDLNKFQYITTVKHDINTSSYEGSKVPLPLKEMGIWYLKVKIGSTEADAYVLRSNIGVLTEEGDNEFIFWGQNFKTKRSVTDGNIKILNLQDSIKELQTISFNAEGIAKGTINADADIALMHQNNDRAIVPINLKYLNTGYSFREFQPKGRLTRYFIFTDRPLYKPGDTVYFKAVLRDDDDARYTIPGGEASARIYSDYYYEGSNVQPIFERNFPISADGTVNGQYQLPATAKVGYHTLAVSVPNQASREKYWNSEWSSNTISFDVQFFRKPEFSIDVTTPKTELIASDKTSFKISGQYFSGQPLLNQKVKYTVHSADFYEYQYVTDQQSLSQDLSDDYRYGYWYGSNKVTEGTATLDKNGEAEIDLDTKINFNKGKSQVFSIEATIDDGSLNPSFSRRNILVYAGEYGIYRKDTSYGAKINTPLSLPVTLIPYRTNVGVGNINLTAKLHRENWISYQEENKKYPSYRKEEEDLPQISAKTDGQGNATFTFTPTKIGSYTITVEGKDARGNNISKIFYSYVSAEDQPYYTTDGSNELTIATDKQKYLPTDTVRFSIFSSVPNRDVFISLERGRVNRFQIVHLNGKNGTVDVPLVNTDVPNIYAKVASFSNYALDSTTVNVPVSSEDKKLIVNITPNSKTFAPGETVTINVSTTDVGGNPVSAELALWTVDKAIFELSDSKLGDIFNTFWKERSNTTQEAHSLEGILVNQAEGGGCFAAGTAVLMADGRLKNIEDVRVGDYVLTRTENDYKLVKAKVTKTHTTEENGYLILNGNLKVTANHIMWVNNKWQEAGNIQIGDMLVDSKGDAIKISSLEWQRGKFNVYNLEVETYHTYFAGGVWVHNEKGLERNAFKDTAYWNPSLRTDGSGRTQVSFKLPDNLTTWTLAAVGATSNTKVGQTTNEIVVTKDVIVRPITPNILRTGDEIVLSAIVQNFTEQDQSFDIDLKFDSGEVDQALQSNVALKSNEMQQFYWKVKPTKENDKSKLVFGTRAKNDNILGDVVTQVIPVRPFGFEERRAEAGEDAKTFQVKLAPDSHKEKSTVTLSLSPAIIGTLPTAMKYLIDYPYGCVEQTTSRFVPAVIAKVNQDLFTEALKDKDINDVIDKGISRLSTLQQGDGGWAWWFSGNSDPYITAYVIEYVIQAKQAGIKVDDDFLKRAQSYLEKERYYDSKSQQEVNYQREDLIAKNYGLILLGAKNKVKKVNDLSNLSPDLLALAVMTNYLNGDKNSQSNGLNQLVSIAQTQGDAVFWEGGNKVNFGSKDASTALAIRAIALAGGDRDLAVKATRYLTRVRQSDYWSNTYATAQVIRALVDLSRTGNELTPNYTYSVTLDGKQIAQGSVSNSKQVIKDIEIPAANLKSGGSSISLTKNGTGQIYSTLVINEFHTDRDTPAVNNGLSVRREYVNEKGEQHTLAVGDTAIVKITVSGLKANENYGVINDELPSGLVPINQAFKNEQYGYDPNTYYSSYGVTDREITENGMVLSLYQIASGERTYTYKARVVNEGTFIVPPATASLMYAPEIYGRSDVQTVKITKESEIIPTKAPKEAVEKYTKQIIAAIILIVLTAIGVIIRMKKRNRPPTPIEPTQPSNTTPGNDQHGQ
ncbi:hypothetical protein HYW54_02950 [Candidatus Gottesmanbacteria bacterium]|nr:hypothetical protein [Candidatus Gottesmanbacteria bacterium]